MVGVVEDHKAPAAGRLDRLGDVCDQRIELAIRRGGVVGEQLVLMLALAIAVAVAMKVVGAIRRAI